MAKPTPMHRPSLTSTATLRAHARKHVEDGAITATYHADRKTIVKRLNDALATEYVCTLRYYQHYFSAKGVLSGIVKPEFLEHAKEEQEHAHQLAERIVQLGGDPDFDPETLTARSHAEFKTCRSLREMVNENLIAERIAIDSYRELIAYVGNHDTTTRRLLERILAQEEEHADEFADMLDEWVGK